MTQQNGPQDPTQWSGQPPHTGGPFPPVPPGPAPKKRNWFARHKVLTGLFGVIAVAVIATATTTSGQSSGTADAGTQPAATSAEATHAAAAPKSDASPHIGTPVKSGDLQFTVTKVERGKSSVGEDFMAQEAQGSYTLVHVTVRNVGDESETFLDSDQKIKDADNKTYSPDSAAEIALDNNDVWLSDINPGNAVDGVLVYDMPAGVRATSIDFSGGLFDDAATVQLH